jgi:protein-tyrosine phosphatase
MVLTTEHTRECTWIVHRGALVRWHEPWPHLTGSWPIRLICHGELAEERFMGPLTFAAARKGGATVSGAQRPGHPAQAVDTTPVSAWISSMQQNGVHRVCCLRAPKPLAYDRLDRLGTSREVFGASNICHAAIEDDHLCDAVTLENSILPCLLQSDRARTPVVVHGSGGRGRPGHVLAAWLARHRGLSVDDALAAVVSTGRCLRATASKPLTT